MGLSVIVPVYNGEKYIKDCLESIINQTYRDLQIIVVNDGSTDNTEAIVREIVDNDSRVQLINKENGGVSSARNLGLEYAKNEFLTFVDSDDTLDIDMYGTLMKYTGNNDYDIVHCGYKRINNNGIKEVNGTGREFIQNSCEALECIIEGKLFVGALWNKIYKIQLFHNIKFDETIKINEDILINYNVFKKSKKSIFIDIPKYNYFEREFSACKNTNQVKKLEDCVKVSRYIYKDCNIALKNKALNKYLISLINLYRECYYSSNKDDRKKCNNIKYEIKQISKEGNITGKKNKLNIIMIRYIPFLYAIAYKIYDKFRVPNWDV